MRTVARGVCPEAAAGSRIAPSRAGVADMEAFPPCRRCRDEDRDGDLVPLSDFGSQGAPIHYKAWVCTNPKCDYNIKIRNGDVILDEPINDGYAPRR